MSTSTTRIPCNIIITICGGVLLFVCTSVIFAAAAAGQDGSSQAGQDNSQNQQLYLGLFEDYDNEQKPEDEQPSLFIHRGLSSQDHLSEYCLRGSFYSSFTSCCQQNVLIVEKLLRAESNATRLIELARRLRDDPMIHPRVWYTALSRVSICRDDLRGLIKPHPVNVIPRDFIYSKVFEEIDKSNGGNVTGGVPVPSTTDGDESDSSSEGFSPPSPGLLEVPNQQCTGIRVDSSFARTESTESKLWYFREDVQINSNHFFWHDAYPFGGNVDENGVTYHADRRGELFYYLHHFFLARYNAERLSNGLGLVPSFDLRPGYVMKGSYDPNMGSTNAGQEFAKREDSTRLPDRVLLPPNFVVSLNQTIVSTVRINQSIDDLYLLAENRARVPLTGLDGIDKLTDVTERSTYSVNPNYYGSMHGAGHLLVSFAHDTSNLSATPTVMYDTTTSMREIIFYYWHGFIDDLLSRHKTKLGTYRPSRGDLQLIWSNVVIDDVQVTSEKSQMFPYSTPNILRTFWSYKEISLTSGLDFRRSPNSTPVKICLKHLNHENFTYEIKLTSNRPQLATIRIFMAPSLDENGQKYSMEQQRKLFFALDTFAVQLSVGSNIISRASINSTLTIPWSQGMYNVDEQSRPYCGCGWPYHMLLPKGTFPWKPAGAKVETGRGYPCFKDIFFPLYIGTPDGMQYNLFVMATDGIVDQTSFEATYDNFCVPAPILCGLPNRKYPDTKPMGYPFDRPAYTIVQRFDDGNGGALSANERVVEDIEEYASFIPNALTKQVTIKFVENVAA